MYERYEQILAEKGLKTADVVKATSVSYANISQWKSGLSTPKQNKLAEIAEYLDVSLSWLMGLSEDKETKKAVRVPVYREVRAGAPTALAEEDIVDYIDIPSVWTKTAEYFGLRVKGDSMEPDLRDGDIVVVKKQPDAETGSVVVALINGEAGICKKLIKRQDGIVLKSINEDYGNYVYTNEQIESLPVTICGVVVRSIREF